VSSVVGIGVQGRRNQSEGISRMGHTMKLGHGRRILGKNRNMIDGK
jgi:hypothetical protein